MVVNATVSQYEFIAKSKLTPTLSEVVFVKDDGRVSVPRANQLLL